MLLYQVRTESRRVTKAEKVERNIEISLYEKVP